MCNCAKNKATNSSLVWQVIDPRGTIVEEFDTPLAARRKIAEMPGTRMRTASKTKAIPQS